MLRSDGVLLGVYLLGLCGLLAGCGGSTASQGDFVRNPVTGTVTLDGNALMKGSIRFFPLETTGASTITGGAILDGKFKLDEKTGLPAGKYKVTISATSGSSEPVDPDKLMSGEVTEESPEELIPAKYNSESELTCEVKADSPNELKFELTTK